MGAPVRFNVTFAHRHVTDAIGFWGTISSTPRSLGIYSDGIHIFRQTISCRHNSVLHAVTGGGGNK